MVFLVLNIYFLERRTIVEMDIGNADLKKILADAPPDETYLYGSTVKESVQKARDSNMLSRYLFL